jgi:septal ring factor EnvC (AmiA/AmiB activator)
VATNSLDMEKWAINGIEQEMGKLQEERESLEARADRLKKALSVLRGKPELAPRARTMSDEARRKISEAQKARWAEKKGHRKPGRPKGSTTTPLTK